MAAVAALNSAFRVHAFVVNPLLLGSVAFGQNTIVIGSRQLIVHNVVHVLVGSDSGSLQMVHVVCCSTCPL